MIRSVVSQLDEDDQFVVVDAGSQDATHDVLHRYRSRITHVEIAPLKQAPAIRWGFDHFASELCCYLNTDDLLLPGAIARVKQEFKAQPRVGAFYSHRVFIDSASQAQRVWHLPAHSNSLMGRWDYIPQETCFWRRQCMEDAGGMDTSLDFAMDYDLFCRLMRQMPMVRLNTYLAAFRDHDASKTANLVSTSGAREVALVRARYGYHTDGGWRLVGRALRHAVEARSRLAWRRPLREALQAAVDGSVG
jgi:glycosyltransferase involved in cell wall biosynthesis